MEIKFIKYSLIQGPFQLIIFWLQIGCEILTWWFCSDYRSSTVGPSDSEKENQSRKDSDKNCGSRLGVTAPSGDSESGGSHSPSPRTSRKRQVLQSHSYWHVFTFCFISFSFWQCFMRTLLVFNFICLKFSFRGKSKRLHEFIITVWKSNTVAFLCSSCLKVKLRKKIILHIWFFKFFLFKILLRFSLKRY